MYQIRAVDGEDEEIAGTLSDLHRLTFFDSAPIPEFDWGHWWLAFHAGTAIAFAGLVPSAYAANAGYFCRVGVMQEHRGRKLQLRLMRAVETRARHNGWHCIVSDTTNNLASANNFIRASYRLHEPQRPWGWPHTLYWRKFIGGGTGPVAQRHRALFAFWLAVCVASHWRSAFAAERGATSCSSAGINSKVRTESINNRGNASP
jgi:GNAT superfamily N-acetyltransferase